MIRMDLTTVCCGITTSPSLAGAPRGEGPGPPSGWPPAHRLGPRYIQRRVPPTTVSSLGRQIGG